MADEPPFISSREYAQRCEAVYWYRAPACRARGPHKATCVLPPDHDGERHEGNGFDVYGPKHIQWSDDA